MIVREVPSSQEYFVDSIAQLPSCSDAPGIPLRLLKRMFVEKYIFSVHDRENNRHGERFDVY